MNNNNFASHNILQYENGMSIKIYIQRDLPYDVQSRIYDIVTMCRPPCLKLNLEATALIPESVATRRMHRDNAPQVGLCPRQPRDA